MASSPSAATIPYRGRAAGRLHPPQSWRRAREHYLTVLDHPWYRLIVELQNAVSVLTMQFWSARQARLLHLPITTGSISSPMGLGSDSEPVEVELCGVRTYLADSMQFMLEYGCRLTPAGCYYLMPSFRGEDVDTTHLPQFFHSEAEVIGGLDDVMRAVEEYIRFLTGNLLSRLGSEIQEAAGSLVHLERAAEGGVFERITFDDAVEFLGAGSAEVSTAPGGWRSISRGGERRLLDAFGPFLWLTHMDHLAVPFYQAFADQDRKKALNADLLFGIGEVVGAGERHASADDLERALALHAVPARSYEWYHELKRRHPLRTAGFGMGVERFLLWVLRHDDIRDIPLALRVNGQDIRP